MEGFDLILSIVYQKIKDGDEHSQTTIEKMSAEVMRRGKPKKKKERADEVWAALSRDTSVAGSMCSSEISEFKVALEREQSMDQPDHLSDLLEQLAQKEAFGVNVLNSREDLMDASLYDDTQQENNESSAIDEIPFIDEAQTKDLEIRVAKFKLSNKNYGDSPPISPLAVAGITPTSLNILSQDNLISNLRTLQHQSKKDLQEVKTEEIITEAVDAEDFLKAFEELDKK